jgi:D-alanyl-D-alanine carboxypeptidase
MTAQQIPALSLAVLHSGKLLFAQGYGLSNVELSVKADERTVYGLASISKTFTATALMLLVADGQCHLDDSIRVYLPEAPASWNPIALRHLLAHTSGLPFQVRFEQYGPCEKFLYRLDVTREEFLRAAVQTPLDFTPGMQTQYSNTGYFLLGIIIERMSGMSYSEWLASRIFHPLSMSSTRMNDPGAIILHRAASYSLEDGVFAECRLHQCLVVFCSQWTRFFNHGHGPLGYGIDCRAGASLLAPRTDVGAGQAHRWKDRRVWSCLEGGA